MKDRTAMAVVLLGLALSIAAVFGQTAGFPFLHFDDDVYVTLNPQVAEGLSPQGARWAFTHAAAGYWHPLTWLSLMADASLFGLWAGGFHLTALLLHFLAAAALFLALRSLTGALWPSALAAALFALHPLHVESVAWISQRKDLLFTLFWFLGMWGYARYARRPAAGSYLAVLACFLLGAMGKPMMVTFPFALLLLDAWPLARFQPRAGERRWAPALRLGLEKLPFILLSLLLVAVSYRTQLGYGAIRGVEGEAGTRWANALVSIWAYLRDTVWPSGLAVYYPFPEGGVPAWAWGPALLGLAGVTLLAWRLRGRRPYLAVGWLWFLGTLVPVLGLVPLGSYARADRFTYLPLVGIFLALSFLAGEWAARGRRARSAVVAVSLLALLLAGAVSFHQTGFFRDSQTLFRRALDQGGEGYVTLAGMGKTFLREERPGEAQGFLLRALELVPEDIPARIDLAEALLMQGQVEQGMAQLERLLREYPRQPGVYLEYARARAGQGRLEEAVAAYREALAWGAEGWEVLNELGVALGALGRHEEARQAFALAVEQDPGRADPWFNLGVSLSRLGREGEAREALEMARRLNPSGDSGKEER